MGDIFLDFRPEVTRSHLEILERTLPGVKGTDYITVIMEKHNTSETEKIMHILKNNGFLVKSKSAFATEFAITAKRLLH